MRIGLVMGALGDPGLNTRLFDASRRYIGDGVTLEHIRLADLPPFVPSGEIPAEVRDLHEHLSQLDGVVIYVTQSLNGVAGTIKNALEWMAVPTSALARKPVAIAGLTRVPSSTFASLQQVRSALTPLDAIVMRQPEYTLEVAPEFFGDNDTIVDVQLADELASFLTAARGYIAHQLRVLEVDPTPTPTTLGVTTAALRSLTVSQVDLTLGGMGSVPGGMGSVANPRRYRA